VAFVTWLDDELSFLVQFLNPLLWPCSFAFTIVATSTNVSSSDCLCAVKLFSLTALRGEGLWVLHLPALLVSTRLDANAWNVKLKEHFHGYNAGGWESCVEALWLAWR
jgi:hypothetical protein